MISASRRGDSISGSPPVRITSQISRVRADIVQRVVVGALRERARLARPDHLAAEAEPAIDRADVHQLEQHAVGIAMHDARDRRMRVIADRIGALVRPAPPVPRRSERTAARSDRRDRRGRSARPSPASPPPHSAPRPRSRAARSLDRRRGPAATSSVGLAQGRGRLEIDPVHASPAGGVHTT